jgi:bacterioferritin
MPEFVKDVAEIRQRAEQKIEEGAVTEAYGGDVERTVSILNEALATEIVCVLRYMHHYFMSTGVHGSSVADEFKEHADDERGHADRIAERIQQLGGKPDFNPRSLLQRSVSQYVEGETLGDMIREDLIAERIVIEVYQKMIRFFRDNDPTTRVMIEGILSDEEEHASDLADLLYIVDPETGKTEGEDPGASPLKLEHALEGAGGQARSRSQSEDEPNAARATHAGNRLRPRQYEEAPDDAPTVRPGEKQGGTRAVRVTKPNRKKRAA